MLKIDEKTQILCYPTDTFTVYKYSCVKKDAVKKGRENMWENSMWGGGWAFWPANYILISFWAALSKAKKTLFSSLQSIKKIFV